MHILFLTDNFPPESNAPATRTFEHAALWVNAGHQVTVVTCCPNFPNGKAYAGYKNRWYWVETIAGIRVVRVKSYMTANERFLKRTLDYLSFMLTGTIAALFQRRCDVIVATSPQFFCGIAGMITSAFKRKPFVLEIRDLWPDSIVALGVMEDRRSIRLLAKLERLMYRRATRIVAVTHASKKVIAERSGNSQKIVVVTNGVDTTLFKPRGKDQALLRQHKLNGKFVVGYIGTHGLAHDLVNVLKAVERLLPYPHIKFFFVGSGADRARVEEVVRKNGLHNTCLLSRQSREAIPDLLALCDVSLVPLRDEPLFAKVIPSKIFECMAMGVPIIMSVPSGEATGIVTDTGCGVVIPAAQPESLALTVKSLAGDAQKMAQLKANAISAAPRYSRDRLATQMLDVLIGSVKDPIAKANSSSSQKSPTD